MAFESERTKLEDEIKKRSSKLKSVDAQRQELLKETHDLGNLPTLYSIMFRLPLLCTILCDNMHFLTCVLYVHDV